MAIVVKFKKRFRRKHKIGLCLSGGGVRGFAHLGAFKAFEECGIKFDAVAGTSIGSAFAAFYAADVKFKEFYDICSSVDGKSFVKQRFGILPSKMDGLSGILSETLPYKTIKELKIPYFAVAVDLNSGKEIDFAEGELIPIITGSCAIPGVFLPVKYKNMTLIDGGVKNNIPADILLKNGCDYVVSIDCNSTRGGGTSSKHLWTQFVTSIGIMMVNNSKHGQDLSDILISPNMKRFTSLKLIEKDAMIEEGYIATMAAMPQIKRLFEGKIKKK